MPRPNILLTDFPIKLFTYDHTHMDSIINFWLKQRQPQSHRLDVS